MSGRSKSHVQYLPRPHPEVRWPPDKTYASAFGNIQNAFACISFSGINHMAGSQFFCHCRPFFGWLRHDDIACTGPPSVWRKRQHRSDRCLKSTPNRRGEYCRHVRSPHCMPHWKVPPNCPAGKLFLHRNDPRVHSGSSSTWRPAQCQFAKAPSMEKPIS